MMIKSIDLQLTGGEFRIIQGDDFTIRSDSLDHLIYEKDEVWHVISDICRGKYADTVITLPIIRSFHKVSVKITDGTLSMCPMQCKEIIFNIRSASVDVADVISQRLKIDIGSGNLKINADSYQTYIDCGYGTVNLNMSREKQAYSIDSKCGMGNVTLNSMLLPKQYKSPEGEHKIHIICGMGEVNINTSPKFCG